MAGQMKGEECICKQITGSPMPSNLILLQSQENRRQLVGGLGVEGLSKKEEGLMDNSVVIAGEGGIRGLNGNGKNIIKIEMKRIKK